MVSKIYPKESAFARLPIAITQRLRRKSGLTWEFYSWLRQRMPEEKPQEVESSDFEEYAECTRWTVSRSIKRLVEAGVIEILKDYGRGVWKLVVLSKEQVVDRMLGSSNNSQSAPEMADLLETVTSNPLPSFPITEKSENYKPGSGFSDFVSQEKESIKTLPQAQPIQSDSLVNGATIGDDHLSAAAAKIESAIGKPLTPALKKLALEASLQVIEDAIAALQEAKTRREGVRDEVAYLIGAIRGEYTPHQPKAIVGSNLKAFGQWFDWAKLKGIAFGSMGVNGGIQVYTIDGEKSFEEAVERFPMT